MLEGASPLAQAFGFKANPQAKAAPVQSVEDLRAPELRIIWEKPVDLAASTLPPNAVVFARERHQQIPVDGGIPARLGRRVVVGRGSRGHMVTNVSPTFRRRSRTWASNRHFVPGACGSFSIPPTVRGWISIISPAAGAPAAFGALQVAAWHYWERDAQNDEYLRNLIDACHRNAIQVYAWLELPHVSEKFWDGHPEWREKTAALQDAQLDWRKLVNLTNRSAFQAVSAGINDLVTRFDWDGVNLAELYFESLEGVDNPARFTPMNDDVRAEFRAAAGFDPLDLFDTASPALLG